MNQNDNYNNYNGYNSSDNFQSNQYYGQDYNQNFNQGYNQSYNQNYNQGYTNNYGQAAYQPAANTISAEKYNVIIGLTLMYGFIVNCLMVNFCADIAIDLVMNNAILFYVSYIIMVIAGTMMIRKSDNPVVSFIGYNLMVVPLGLVLTTVLTVYTAAGYSSTITIAFAITGIVTLAMMLLAAAIPNFFLSLGRTLCVSLLLTVVLELILFFAGASLGIIDYIVVLIFCGYIGYDWAKANQCEKTVDNAIDSASELYIDIVNLFLRILRILARSQRN